MKFRLIIYILLVPMLISAQKVYVKKDTKAEKKKREKIELKGLYAETDIAAPVKYLLNGKTAFDEGITIRANLSEKYFPNLELGYGASNQLNSIDLRYNGRAPYFIIGTDFNLLKNENAKSSPSENFFLLGAKIGGTYVNYSLSNDSVQFTNSFINRGVESASKSLFWYEISAGLRVKLYKNIYAGWSIRKKTAFTAPEKNNASPEYYPGYGMNNSGNWTFDYTIGIRLR